MSGLLTSESTNQEVKQHFLDPFNSERRQLDKTGGSDRPEAIFVTGQPGSGKTTLRNRILQLSAKPYYILDLDDVRSRLMREFSSADATISEWNKVASKYLNVMRDYAVEHHKNLLFDQSGKNGEALLRTFKQLRKNNYHLGLYVTATPFEISMLRCAYRFINECLMGVRTPRLVPYDFQADACDGLADTLLQIERLSENEASDGKNVCPDCYFLVGERGLVIQKTNNPANIHDMWWRVQDDLSKERLESIQDMGRKTQEQCEVLKQEKLLSERQFNAVSDILDRIESRTQKRLMDIENELKKQEAKRHEDENIQICEPENCDFGMYSISEMETTTIASELSEPC